jgi:hypothetical protein
MEKSMVQRGNSFFHLLCHCFFLGFNKLPKGKEGQIGMAKDKAGRGKMKR